MAGVRTLASSRHVLPVRLPFWRLSYHPEKPLNLFHQEKKAKPANYRKCHHLSSGVVAVNHHDHSAPLAECIMIQL